MSKRLTKPTAFGAAVTRGFKDATQKAAARAAAAGVETHGLPPQRQKKPAAAKTTKQRSKQPV